MDAATQFLSKIEEASLESNWLPKNQVKDFEDLFVSLRQNVDIMEKIISDPKYTGRMTFEEKEDALETAIKSTYKIVKQLQDVTKKI
jgi:hypothetical protein